MTVAMIPAANPTLYKGNTLYYFAKCTWVERGGSTKPIMSPTARAMAIRITTGRLPTCIIWVMMGELRCRKSQYNALRMDVLWYLAYGYTPAKIAQMLSRFAKQRETEHQTAGSDGVAVHIHTHEVDDANTHKSQCTGVDEGPPLKRV